MIFSDSNNVMHFESDTAAAPAVVPVSTVLARVVVAPPDSAFEGAHGGKIVDPSGATAPVAVGLTGFDSVGVVFSGLPEVPRDLSLLGCEPTPSKFGVGTQTFVDVVPVGKGRVPWLKTHLADGRVIALGHPTVPSSDVLTFAAVRMVASHVPGVAKPFTLLPVHREREKGFTTSALAGHGFANSLCFGSAHGDKPRVKCQYIIQENEKAVTEKERELLESPESLAPHNVAGNGKRDGLRSGKDWVISSQASRKRVEGSTTRVWSLRHNGMAVKPHECAPRKGRYSLVSRESARSGDIKKAAITQRPYTGKLDNLSKHPVKEIVVKALKNDANKAMERAAHAQFDRTVIQVVPTNGNSATAITVTTNSTPAETNNVAMGNTHVKLIADQMKERNVPTYDGNNYFAVGRPASFRGFKDDLEALHSYVDTGFQMILNGEIGRSYEGVRFFEQTAIPSEGWSNALSDAVYFFGEDTVAEAIAIPEEIRGKIPSDYGRSRGVAWYYLGGFGIVHRNTSDVWQSRIYKWGSAA